MKKDKPVLITRESADPMALRASIGGNEKLGYYLVFRGSPHKVLDMLHQVVNEAEQKIPNADYTDKRGRPQG